MRLTAVLAGTLSTGVLDPRLDEPLVVTEQKRQRVESMNRLGSAGGLCL
jgi:hypothetical protein